MRQGPYFDATISQVVYNNQTRNMKTIEMLSNSVIACSSNWLSQIHNEIFYITLHLFIYILYTTWL